MAVQMPRVDTLVARAQAGGLRCLPAVRPFHTRPDTNGFMCSWPISTRDVSFFLSHSAEDVQGQGAESASLFSACEHWDLWPLMIACIGTSIR